MALLWFTWLYRGILNEMVTTRGYSALALVGMYNSATISTILQMWMQTLSNYNLKSVLYFSHVVCTLIVLFNQTVQIPYRLHCVLGWINKGAVCL